MIIEWIAHHWLLTWTVIGFLIYLTLGKPAQRSMPLLGIVVLIGGPLTWAIGVAVLIIGYVKTKRKRMDSPLEQAHHNFKIWWEREGVQLTDESDYEEIARIAWLNGTYHGIKDNEKK